MVDHSRNKKIKSKHGKSLKNLKDFEGTDEVKFARKGCVVQKGMI